MLLEHLLKTIKEYKNLKKQEVQEIFIKVNWTKHALKHHVIYIDFKDLLRKTTSGNVLSDKACNIAKNPKYDRYQRDLAPVVYKTFDVK